jgi:hypothetical protein
MHVGGGGDGRGSCESSIRSTTLCVNGFCADIFFMNSRQKQQQLLLGFSSTTATAALLLWCVRIVAFFVVEAHGEDIFLWGSGIVENSIKRGCQSFRK